MSGDPRILVAHVIHRLAVGGLENGLVNLINHLPAERYRHAVVCVTDATDFARRITRPDVEIVELRKPPGNSLAIHARFHRVFRGLRPHVVHTRNLAALEAQAAAALARVPVRVHGEHGWDTADPDGTSVRHARIRRLFSPLVHRYVALSAHIEEYLVARVGIARERIARICNGVDCERFAPAVEARTGFPHVPFRDPRLVLVGTVGRLEAVKDQLMLAQAFVDALRAEPRARDFLRLAIVGDGTLRPAIEALLAQHGAADLAWLPGARADVPAWLPALDIFALPSRAEGISNTILEAMACGVPVVATRVGGNPELVADGETGMLVPPADSAPTCAALLALANDTPRRRRMSRAARARAVREFALPEMTRRYADVYEGALSRHGVRRGAAMAQAPATLDTHAR